MRVRRCILSWALYACGLVWYWLLTRWLEDVAPYWLWNVAYRPYNFFMTNSANVQGETVYGPWSDSVSGRTR